MLNSALRHIRLTPYDNPLVADTLAWFLKLNDGHMGKWQYCDSKNKSDVARGAELWEKWIKSSSPYYMLKNQATLIKKHVQDILHLTGPIESIIDLGPGEKNSVITNTLPFIKALPYSLKAYTPIDLCRSHANDAKKVVRKMRPDVIGFPQTKDFLQPGIHYPKTEKSLALCLGGIVGNYTGTQNSKNALAMLVKELKILKGNLPYGGYLVVGLDANQDAFSLLESYDQPLQAEFEINIMHRLKRDILFDQSGYKAEAWKYKVKWFSKSYQICHIAEATEDQCFRLDNEYFEIRTGEQFVIDGSFKFPVGVFQQAAIHAGYEPLASYIDDDKRMALHVLRVVE